MIVAADPARLARLWPPAGSAPCPKSFDASRFGHAADGRWLADLRKGNRFGSDPLAAWTRLGWKPAPGLALLDSDVLPPLWLVADLLFDDAAPAELVARLPPPDPEAIAGLLARIARRVGPLFSWLADDDVLWLRGPALVPRSLALALDGTGAELAKRFAPGLLLPLGSRPLFVPAAAKPGTEDLIRLDAGAPGLGRREPIPSGFRPFDAAGAVRPDCPQIPATADVPLSSIALKLVPTGRVHEPNLWRVPGPLPEVVAGLIARLPEQVLEDLVVAPLLSDRGPACLIRTAQRLAEAADLPGEPLRAVPGLPLWLPARSEFRPALRRDFLRDVFAGDADVTWVEPSPTGGVTANRVASAGFRPLLDHVEWAAPDPLPAVPVGPDLSAFTLLPFDSETDLVRNTLKKRRDSQDIEVETSRIPKIQASVGQRPPKKVRPPAAPEWVMPGKPATMREELARLGDEFLALGGPIDEPRKLAYWPRLARLHEGLGEPFEALLCRSFAAWMAGPHEGDLIAGWASGGRQPPESQQKTFAELARRPTGQEQADGVRRIFTLDPHGSEAARARTWLAAHEHHLPVASAWLAWRSLAGGDALMLARARDRLLNRLFHEGVRRDRDLPGVLLRGSASKLGWSATEAGSFWQALRAAAPVHQERFQKVCGDAEAGAAVRSLILAYALARAGHSEEARAAYHAAGGPGPSARVGPGEWLWRAYLFRAEELLAGKGTASPWPEDLMRAYGLMSAPERVAVDRYRKHSRILEPFERIDPYRHQRGGSSPVLDRLAATSDGAEARAAFARLFDKEPSRADLRALAVSVPMGFRLGADFATKMLDRLLAALPKLGALDLVELLDLTAAVETGAALAGQYQKEAEMVRLLGWLETLFGREPAERCAWMAGALSRNFGWLVRMGHAEWAGRLKALTLARVTGGRALDEFLRTPRLNWPVVLPALLRFVPDWHASDRRADAEQVLGHVQAILDDPSASSSKRFPLAVAYLKVLGEISPAMIASAAEQFGEPSFYTAPDSFDLQPAEAALLARGNDEVASDARLRQVAEEVEFVLRRKIHTDYGAAG